MTKVLLKLRCLRVAAAFGLGLFTLPMARAAAEKPTDPAAEKPAQALYLQLGQVKLDPGRVYKVRGASLDRSAVHITLEDGTIGFTQDVMGRITGAFFEGDGEVLLTPPSDVERRQMSLFTGMAILEEHFSTAYFRFNDETAAELRPDLRAPDNNPQEFVQRWDAAAQNLAEIDAMRLLISFSRLLPAERASSTETANLLGNNSDRFLRARLQGNKLGVFDVLYDSLAAEQVEAGQAKAAENGATYYDVWTSFSPQPAGAGKTTVGSTSAPGNPGPREDWIAARRYAIQTEVHPPKIHSRARVELAVKEGGTRALLFELSRFLQVESVKLDGREVEFVHNPAVEGTQLSRRGNDIVAVILPEPVSSGQKIDLEFVYGGEVLAEAGPGLLYVGARGTWYPNRGMAMADYDLEFDYPTGWTLVATGKAAAVSGEAAAAKARGEQTARFVSERPIPLAGFNLGKYKVATAQAGKVTVETYATQGVERDFPSEHIQVLDPDPVNPIPPRGPPAFMPNRPSPAQTEATVGQAAARAIQYYAERFGAYPYSRLALTQMPGRDSQGWPGLVFLSSYAFLDQQQREQLHFEPYRILIQQMIPAHETAHQWWGDLIPWSGYRDQWFSEGLANYCALMMLQEKNPGGFRQIMEEYRRDLVQRNKDGRSAKDAGPVTLGVRLLSSKFPYGYEAISYGRGTWLFYMLRSMLNDAARQEAGQKQSASTDEPFVRALRKVRERYEGRSISTAELMNVFAEELPPALRFEGKKSLDWFVEGWINGTALPRFELKSVKFAPKGTGLLVSGTIVQTDAPEDLVTSVPIYGAATGKQWVLLGRVFADGTESAFHVAAPAGTHKIVLDPYETILTNPK